ncbi:MAG: DUF72 domain-containing protein [Betaproteobacteria bacterium]
MSKVYLGTIGWSYDFWKGTFYPSEMPSKDFLAYYSTQFGTVEVDSTFYRVPNEQTILSWKEHTPEGFYFSLKFPQIITHAKRVQDCQNETDTFLARASLLGDKLGVLLLQFPPNFGVSKFAELESYLQKLPSIYRYAVEVRNKSWLSPEFYQLLKRHNVALVWPDSPRMPQSSEKTADFLYIRWEGNRKLVNGTLGKIEVDRKADLAVWAQKIKPYLNDGTRVFGYFGKYFSGSPPSDVVQLEGFLGTDIRQQMPLGKG